MTLGLIHVLREMSYHVIPPAWGPAYATAALCAGIVLGLWVPRRIIRRRLESDGPHADTAVSAGFAGAAPVKLDFAASLAGALIIALGLLWVMLCGGATFMEEYRAVLVRRFLHPVQLTHLLLWAPACAGLVFTGAIGTTLLVALHGWYRLITQPNTKVGRLWASMLLGALAAGLLARQTLPATALAWLAPLLMFVAGAISVAYRSDAVQIPARQPTPRRLTRDELLPLLAAALAAAVAGCALFLTISQGRVASQGLATGVVVLAAAACAGLLVAGGLWRLRLNADLGPPVLLLSAVTLLLPYQQVFVASVNVAFVRLAVVTGCAAICAALVGHRVRQFGRSMQDALSWTGRCVAGGFGLALALSPVCAARYTPSTPVMAVALIATAGTGLILILDSRAKAALRIATLIAAGLWLVSVPFATSALAATLRGQEPALPPAVTVGPLVDTARRLVIADKFRTATVRPHPPSMNGATAWQFDLAGPTLDAVVLERVTGADDQSVSDRELGRRLLRRLTSRLAHGGRLLVELPTAPFVAAALRDAAPPPPNSDATWNGYRLRVRSDAGEYEAVVFGNDIPALIKRYSALPGLEVSLRPLREPIEREP